MIIIIVTIVGIIIIIIIIITIIIIIIITIIIIIIIVIIIIMITCYYYHYYFHRYPIAITFNIEWMQISVTCYRTGSFESHEKTQNYKEWNTIVSKIICPDAHSGFRKNPIILSVLSVSAYRMAMCVVLL